MYGSGFDKEAPVKDGQEIDVKIDGVGEKGDGIARVDGFVLFIPGVREGDEVRVKITKVLSKVGFAEVVGKGSARKAKQSNAEMEAEDAEPEEVPEDTTDFGEDL
jgi:predicted RNA-binding protein with TRAM domain